MNVTRLAGPGMSGDVRLIHGVPAPTLDGGTRDLVVYLPPGYDSSDKAYPVVYAHDGQNVFNPGTAFLGREWRLDETAEHLIKSGRMPPCIIVGVYNGPKRVEEYTSVADAEWGGGHADDYASFLIDNAKPFVDAHFRTRADAAHTATMGSSLGGLVSLYLSFNHPEVFGLCGALSPSLWFAERHMTKALAASNAPGPGKVWIDMGTREGSHFIDDLRDMGQVLRDKGYRDGSTLHYHEIQDGTHDEPSWAGRGGDVLQAIVPPDPGGASPWTPLRD
jgi:predicted alpha/beta superfamily hydrolase